MSTSNETTTDLISNLGSSIFSIIKRDTPKAQDTPTENSPLLRKPSDTGSSVHRIASNGDPRGDEENQQNESNGSQQPPDINDAPTPESIKEMRSRMTYIFLAVAIGVFLAAADQTIIVSSYGKIGSELEALNKTSWIANAYFLTLTAFQPMYGKLSDIFGRRECLMFSYFVFGLGCLFCGLSTTINQLILSRAFAGIGGGGMTTLVSILISDIIPLRERGTWQGYINIVYSSGAAVGAPLGGVIADYVNWRWAFLVQTPFCLVALIAVFFLLDLPKREQTHWKTKIRRIDFLGAVILLVSITTLLVGLDRGSNIAWSDRLTIVYLASSVPLILLFMIVERFIAAEPFAPGHIIFERSVFASYICCFFSFGGWLATLFYIPFYFQAVYGMSATQSSLLLIPAIVCGVSGSLAGGLYMQKTGKYYWLTVNCYIALVLGLLTIVAFSGVIISSIPGMVVGMMICAFSNGIGVTSTLIALLANATPEDQAIATACSYLFRSLGSVFGLALASTAINQLLRTTLREQLGSGREAEKIANGVRRNLDLLKKLEPKIRDVVRECYATSTRIAFSLQVIVVAGAVVSAFFIREKPLNR